MEDDVAEILKDLEESGEPSPGNAVMRPLVLSLIHSSYVHTATLSEFARDVVAIVNTAVSVPVAFAEGFLRSFLAIQSVREDDSGHIVIVPKPGASEEEIFREVDQITAQIEPGAVYNPLVREQMDRLAEATTELMRADLAAMADLSSEELHLASRICRSASLPRRRDAASNRDRRGPATHREGARRHPRVPERPAIVRSAAGAPRPASGGADRPGRPERPSHRDRISEPPG